MKEKIFCIILAVALLIFSLVSFYNGYQLQHTLRNGVQTKGIITKIVNQIRNEYITIQYSTPTGDRTYTTSMRTNSGYYTGEYVLINYDINNSNNVELGSPFFQIGHDYNYIIESSELLLLSILCFYAFIIVKK